MDTVILGASGFIGQNLVRVLSNLGEIHAVSLRKPDWKDRIKNYSIVINLIGKAHDHKGVADERDYYIPNVQLVKDIFEVFISSEAKLMIHISSLGAVEEFESIHPLTENETCRPVSWYGKSKRAAEKWLLEQTLPLDKKLIILRPPMIHGPGDKGNLGLLYKLIARGIPYPLAAFDNKRSFMSIDNFCYSIIQILEKYENMESGIYHISDDEPISTGEIIGIIKDVTKKNTPDLYLPKSLIRAIARIGDIIPLPLNTKRLKKMTSSLLVSNSKIKKALGIERMPVSAKEGLKKTIQSFNPHP